MAFALNGVIAVLTALSFAEVASKFPESGGTYTFSKKVLSIEAAFAVGWVVWFASIVAATLYALGFGEFASQVLRDGWTAADQEPPSWLTGRWAGPVLAIAGLLFYAIRLAGKAASGGKIVNVTKLIVFAVLILCGLWFLPQRSFSDIRSSLQPFFAEGGRGLFQAMGFTFIAFQGFDLIAAVGGEVRQPERNIPARDADVLGPGVADLSAAAVRDRDGGHARRRLRRGRG